MKKLNASSVIAAVLLLTITACSIFPSPSSIKVHYYDIGFPVKKYSSPIGIHIFPFQGGVGDETRMIFRTAPNVIQFDSYNRWAISPARLLQRYFALTLIDSTKEITHSMTGEILRFEGDLVQKTANITVKITLKADKQDKNDKILFQRICSSSIPVKEETATAYAAAMEKAIADVTRQIAEQLKKLKK